MKWLCLSVVSPFRRFWRALARAILAGVLALSGTDVWAENVDLSGGAATFTVPIETPAGTNGMGPSLALEYNSGARGSAAFGEDWMGAGWRLKGLGYIERRGPNYGAVPTYQEGVDTFVLDLGAMSGKLVRTGVDPATGATGEYYRTKNDNRMRILRESIGTVGTWVLTDTRGTKYYFGTEPSRNSGPRSSTLRNPNNDAQVVRWYLRKVENTHGVYWEVFYDVPPASSPDVREVLYPAWIEYSKGPGLGCTDWQRDWNCSTVEFKTAPNLRKDTAPIYLAGGSTPHHSTAGLTAIVVSLRGVSWSSSPSFVKSYRLKAVPVPSPMPVGYAKTWQLGSVELGDARVNPTSLESASYQSATTFQYHANTLPTVSLGAAQAVSSSPTDGVGDRNGSCSYTVDLDRDGYPDVFSQSGPVGGPFTTTYFRNRSGTGAFDGSVYVASGSPLPALCVSDPAAEPKPRAGYLKRMGKGFSMYMKGLFDWSGLSGQGEGIVLLRAADFTMLDFDGDGRIDVLQNPSSTEWYWWRNVTAGPGAQITFAARASIVNPPPASVRLETRDTGALDGVFFADMDADGLADLVRIERTSWINYSGNSGARSEWSIVWWRNLGGGALSASPTTMPKTYTHTHDVTTCNQGRVHSPHDLRFLDINGDGVLDLVYTSFVGSSTCHLAVIKYLPGMGGGTRFGEPKTLLNSETGEKLIVSIYGNRVNPYIPSQILSSDPFLPEWHNFADINGDGLLDLVVGLDAALVHPEYPYSGYHYFPQFADGTFGNARTLSGAPSTRLTREKQVVLDDMDGDGYADILSAQGGNYTVQKAVVSSPHQALKKVTLPLGGTISFDYQRYKETGRLISKFVPSRVCRWGSIEAAGGCVDYTFQEATYAFAPEHEFRGFGYAKEMAMGDASAEGTVKFTRFNVTNPALEGKPNIVYLGDVSSKPYEVRYFTYGTSTPYPGVTSIDWMQEKVNTIDGVDDGGDKVVTTTVQFDGFGNPTSKLVSAADIYNRTTNWTYQYNRLAYIVGLPSKEETGTTAYNGGLISRTTYSYDNQAPSAPPTKGDLTREERWLNGGVTTSPVVEYAYDAVGNRVGMKTATAVANPAGNVCSSTGYSTYIEYDSVLKRFPVTVTDALCRTVRNTYWGLTGSVLSVGSSGAYLAFPGQLETTTDLEGVRVDHYWDAFGRRKAQVIPPDAGGATTSWTYFDTSLADPFFPIPDTVVESRREGSGELKTYTHLDGFGRPIQSKAEAEAPGTYTTVTTRYNTRGLIASRSMSYLATFNGYQANSSNPVITYSYDPIGRKSKVTRPDGSARTTSHFRSVVTSTDEKGYVIKRTYDTLGRLTKVEEPAGAGAGGVTTYSYDTYDGNHHEMRKTTDAAGNVTVAEYDTLGRLRVLYDPDLGNRKYSYDLDGRLTSVFDAKGQTIGYSYDTLGRMVRKDHLVGGVSTTVASYFYGEGTPGAYRRNRLWRVYDPSGSTTFSYDQRGNVTRTDKLIGTAGFVTQYTYDSMNRVVNTTYPTNEVVQNSYNAQGFLDRVRSLTYNVDYVANLDYNAAGKVTSKTLGNGKVTTYTYHPQTLRLSNLSTPGLQNLSYTFDAVGNVSGITDTVKPANTQNFNYDVLHRLTSASSAMAPTYSQSFTYNAIGNLTSGDGVTYSFPPAGAPRPHAPTGHSNNVSISYDANGNQASWVYSGTSPFTDTLAWNPENRLMQVSRNGTVTGSFTYDYADSRVKKVEGASTTLVPFKHYRTVSGAATSYYFANGERIAERDATGVYYYHNDHLGSTSLVTNSAGGEVKSLLYYPYGGSRQEGGTKPLAFRFTSQERDAGTGLYYYGARYLGVNGMKRFISPDPVDPNLSDPQTLNRYAYVLNNPIKYVDPTGYEATLMLGGSAAMPDLAITLINNVTGMEIIGTELHAGGAITVPKPREILESLFTGNGFPYEMLDAGIYWGGGVGKAFTKGKGGVLEDGLIGHLGAHLSVDVGYQEGTFKDLAGESIVISGMGRDHGAQISLDPKNPTKVTGLGYKRGYGFNASIAYHLTSTLSLRQGYLSADRLNSYSSLDASPASLSGPPPR